MNLLGLICARRGHEWFPDDQPREFIPVESICLRCKATLVLLPWGRCIGGHPLSRHYNEAGEVAPFSDCPGPH